MSTTPTSGELAVQRLGATIRRLRTAARLSGAQLGTATHMSQSRISKIETGVAAPTADDLDRILGVLSVPPDVAGQVKAQFGLLAMPEGDFHKTLGVGLAWKQREFRRREAATTVLREVDVAVVPGLLQTEDYMIAIYRMLAPMSDRSLHEAVDARMARQELLWYEGKRFEFIIMEAALWSPPASLDVQLAQLDRIARLAERRNIRIGIVTHGSPLPLQLTNYTIFDETYVSAENVGKELISDTPESIRAYLRNFAQLAAVAHYDDVPEILRSVAEALEAREAA